MDLCELGEAGCNRHPWELVRLEILKEILMRNLASPEWMHILDIGCGDGYMSSGLFKNADIGSLTCIDINLSEEQISALSGINEKTTYYDNYGPLKQNFYDLVLCLDVIEHVEDDVALLSGTVRKNLAAEGHMLITVPAFQGLLGTHDEFLGHYRRYSVKELHGVIFDSGLKVISFGYMFSTLLAIRFFMHWTGKIFGAQRPGGGGIGNWRHGKLFSDMVLLGLRVDSAVMFAFSRLGIKIPGLSLWALCKKQ